MTWSARPVIHNPAKTNNVKGKSMVKLSTVVTVGLLALGSAIWVPNLGCWLGVIVMVLGSDLRARSEEPRSGSTAR